MKKSLIQRFLFFFMFLFCNPVTLHAAVAKEFSVPFVIDEPAIRVISIDLGAGFYSEQDSQIANTRKATANARAAAQLRSMLLPSPIPLDRLIRERGYKVSERYWLTLNTSSVSPIIVEEVTLHGLPEEFDVQLTHLNGKKVTSTNPGILALDKPFVYDLHLKVSGDIPLGEYTLTEEFRIRSGNNYTSDIIFEVSTPCETKLDVLGQNVEASDEPGLIAEISPNGYLNKQGRQILESDVFLLDPAKYVKEGVAADGNARLLLRAQSNQPGYIAFSLGSLAQGFTLETLKRDMTAELFHMHKSEKI